MSETITLESLLTALGESSGPLDGYRTRAEWERQLGVGPVVMRRLMATADEQSKLLRAYERRPALDGRLARVPVYRFAVEDKSG